MLALAAEVGGGLDAYRERPRISYVCCTSSPLGIGGELLDASIGVARHGGPVVVYPMPIAGATAPLTVAGAVTINTAEFLGVATAIELAAPGSRQIMASAPVCSTCTPRRSPSAPSRRAHVRHRRRRGAPPRCARARPRPGDRRQVRRHPGRLEKALKGLIVAAAGADLMTGGIGLLSGAGIMSLPQIVIDAEMATMIHRLLAGAEISPETVLAEAITRRRFKGDYLKEKDTARRLRAGEVFVPEIASRLSLEQWKAAGADEVAAASARVRELVAAADARGPVLPPETIARLDAIAGEAEAGKGGD